MVYPSNQSWGVLVLVLHGRHALEIVTRAILSEPMLKIRIRYTPSEEAEVSSDK
jgi:hypothetical protein